MKYLKIREARNQARIGPPGGISFILGPLQGLASKGGTNKGHLYFLDILMAFFHYFSINFQLNFRAKNKVHTKILKKRYSNYYFLVRKNYLVHAYKFV